MPLQVCQARGYQLGNARVALRQVEKLLQGASELTSVTNSKSPRINPPPPDRTQKLSNSTPLRGGPPQRAGSCVACVAAVGFVGVEGPPLLLAVLVLVLGFRAYGLFGWICLTRADDEVPCRHTHPDR